VTDVVTAESPLCHSGEVLRGKIKPNQCPAFGKECTPRTPLGATMVSTEGACAAYYQYGRFVQLEIPVRQKSVGQLDSKAVGQ
jgi:hydrogenase expression/formation protein HypD